MTRLLTDEKLRDEFRARGRERARLYTWERGAQQMMQVLQDVARRP